MYRTTPLSSTFTGWFKDDITPASKFYYNGTLVMTASGNDLTLADKLTVDGTSALTGVVTVASEYALPTADGSNTEQLETNGADVVTWEGAV
jgi:hypothetical protein